MTFLHEPGSIHNDFDSFSPFMIKTGQIFKKERKWHLNLIDDYT